MEIRFSFCDLICNWLLVKLSATTYLALRRKCRAMLMKDDETIHSVDVTLTRRLICDDSSVEHIVD